MQVPTSFMKNLPLSKSKVKCRRLKLVGEGLAKQKIIRMKDAIKTLNNAILDQEIRIDHLKSKQKVSHTSYGDKEGSRGRLLSTFNSPQRSSSMSMMQASGSGKKSN